MSKGRSVLDELRAMGFKVGADHVSDAGPYANIKRDSTFWAGYGVKGARTAYPSGTILMMRRGDDGVWVKSE